MKDSSSGSMTPKPQTPDISSLTLIPDIKRPSPKASSSNTAIREEPSPNNTDVPMFDVSMTERQRSRSKSESTSPIPAPQHVRFPTPTSLGGSIGRDNEEPSPTFLSGSRPASAELHANLHRKQPEPMDLVPSQTVATASTDAEMTIPVAAWNESSSKLTPTSPIPVPPLISAAASTSPRKNDHLSPIELVRVGTTILDRLLSNPACKDFVSKVPQSVTNYHAVIRKPMDLTTIEHKLWKGFQISQAYSNEPSTSTMIAAMSYISLEEGYLSLEDLERDLQRIFSNATYFNTPTHTIHKQAQAYKNLFSGLLQAYHEK
ncbi:hypothetical protein BGX28_001595 [Mortierella sp. GBA30]|nr:hypothetical protein BGX28_001595 [Mortierella sp. GBA30]